MNRHQRRKQNKELKKKQKEGFAYLLVFTHKKDSKKELQVKVIFEDKKPTPKEIGAWVDRNLGDKISSEDYNLGISEIL
jgi:hypothetical protein